MVLLMVDHKGLSSSHLPLFGGRRLHVDERLLYSFDMRWWRHSRLVHAVAMLLLLWTAADLSNASLCALDNEGTGPFPVSTGATLQDSSDSQVPAQAPQHIDDCFCCSHCVDVKALTPAALATPADAQRTPLVLAAPRLFGSRLYHPPLSSLQ